MTIKYNLDDLPCHTPCTLIVQMIDGISYDQGKNSA